MKIFVRAGLENLEIGARKNGLVRLQYLGRHDGCVRLC